MSLWRIFTGYENYFQVIQQKSTSYKIINWVLFQDGRLQIDDQLMVVNGELLLEKSNADATIALRLAMKKGSHAPGFISVVAARNKSNAGPHQSFGILDHEIRIIHTNLTQVNESDALKLSNECRGVTGCLVPSATLEEVLVTRSCSDGQENEYFLSDLRFESIEQDNIGLNYQTQKENSDPFTETHVAKETHFLCHERIENASQTSGNTTQVKKLFWFPGHHKLLYA